MTELPIYNKIFVILIDLIGIWLAFIVYSNNPKGKPNKIFLWMAVFMILWVDFAFLARLVGRTDLSLAKTFLHIAWFVTPLFCTTLYFLIIYLLKKEKEYRLITAAVGFVGISSALITGFTDLVVTGTRFVNEILRIVYGPGMIPFLVGMSFIICATLYPLFKEYLKGSAEERKKLDYFIVGALIFYLANIIFNITLPLFYDIARFYFIGDYSAIFLLGFTAFAIVKHELFGIKVVLTALLVGVIAIILAIQIFTAPSFGWRMLNSGVLAIFGLFGYYLVKAVQGEERRREEAEMMVVREGALRKRAEKLGQEFKRLDESKTQFMLAAQHHLRTPLTAIQGYLSMLYEGSWGRINPEARSKIKSAFESTRKLIRLVNEFLDIAQFEAGKEAIIKREIQPEKVVKEVVEELKPEAEKKELYLKFEKPEALPKIMADPEKIKEALYNVIFNAIKYTEDGGVTIKIEETKKGETVLFTIRDTGIGMERDETLSLFQKSFARGEEAKKLYTTGRGIGLYLSYQIVKAHGGRIWAESEGKDKGSAFYIELPIKQKDEKEDGNDNK